MKCENSTLLKKNHSPIIQNSAPVRMLIACFISSVFGVVLMAVLEHYLLMVVFICVILCLCVTVALFVANKINITTACITPILLLCFLYTPLSWLTFDGLLGCTPYLSILFATIITLSYYGRIQKTVLSLYAFMILGLIVYWFFTWPGEKNMEQVINILIAYLLTATLNIIFIETVKHKNSEINKLVTELSLRDELTGLLNRRSANQIFGNLEEKFKNESADYAVVMMDVDKFKRINDLFGHNLGDSVLKDISSIIQKSIRAEDYAFRFGGDEFLLVLPIIDEGAAHKICEQIEFNLQNIQGYTFPLTVSSGFALRSKSTSSVETLSMADQLMYEAKNSKCSEPCSATVPQ